MESSKIISNSYEKKIRDKLVVECLYDVESWYESLKDFTFKTYFLSMTIKEGKILRKYYKYRFLNGEKLNETEIAQLNQLKDKIDLVIKEQFPNQGIFLRLSTRSPKDSALDFSDEKKNEIYCKGIIETLKNNNITGEIINSRIENSLKNDKTNPGKQKNDEFYLNLLNDEESNAILVYAMNASKQSLKVFNGEQALDLLSSSERVSVNLCHLLIYKELEEVSIFPLNQEEELCKIVFRQWVDINDLEEFRCFFYQKKLTAISQYNFYIYDKNLKDKKEEIKEKIHEEFLKIVPFLNVENGVIDFAVLNNKVWVVELNPFNDYEGAGTGGALFSWNTEMELLKNGPLTIRVIEKPLENASHRISLFGCEKLLVNSILQMLNEYNKKKSCIIY